MQRGNLPFLSRAISFHFPLVREMQLSSPSSPMGTSRFSFPACTRDATQCLEYQRRKEVFISRLYARCNRGRALPSRLLRFSFPACTRDATRIFVNASIAVAFSFPACTRDATRLQLAARRDGSFSFPACTRDATRIPRISPCPQVLFISRLYARCNCMGKRQQNMRRDRAFCANLVSADQPAAIFLGHRRCLVQVRASRNNRNHEHSLAFP